MKNRFLTMAVALFATLSIFTSCEKDEDVTISFSALPAAAQTTINTHFDKEKIMLISFDKEFLDKEYKVIFFDATLIEFDKNGVWENIESMTTGVPKSILPTAIADYLAANYPDVLVAEIEKDKTGYEVKLVNKIELEFDSAGVLVGADL